ncbi:MAG: cytochrome c maturation protein CcmE domain-containing protein [Acidimicrobiales bacterium]
MSDVDIAGSPVAPPTGAHVRVTGPGSSAHPGAHRMRARYLVVGAVLVGAFAFLLAKGLGGSLDYFETVDQALAHKATLGSRTFRLEGLVVPGTVERTGSGVDFVAAGTTRRVLVENFGNPPQLFQPDVPVVVVGHFVGDTFVSSQIIVDHSAQYVEQHPNRVRAPNGTTR